MSLEIKNAADIKHYWGRWIFYGETRTKKTRCAGTFPKPLFLAVDTEGGILAVRDMGCDYVSVHDPDDVLDALDELHAMSDKGKLKHRTLIIDSLTILQENQLEGLLANRRDYAEKKRKKDGRANYKITSSDVVNLTDADWGTVVSTLRSMLVSAHDLPMHVIWTALVQREYSSEDGRTQHLDAAYPLIYTRQAARKIGGFMDHIWYFESMARPNKGPLFRIHTTPYQKCVAGSRDDLPVALKPDYKSFAKDLGLSRPKKTKRVKRKTRAK